MYGTEGRSGGNLPEERDRISKLQEWGEVNQSDKREVIKPSEQCTERDSVDKMSAGIKL